MLRNRLSSALVLCALLAVAARAALAQSSPAIPWEGPAAIGVEVKDQSGKAVVGAHVTLRYTDTPSPVGPAPLVTDAKGQVVVGHLAEGSWYVEVSHPEAMLFTAYLELKVGKAAKSTFAAQVSTGS